jgi:hypothetical protein
MEDLADAMAAADERAIRDILRPDAVVLIDGGGLVAVPATPVEGRFAAAAALVALSSDEPSATVASINGVPGFVLSRNDVVVAAVTAEARARLLSSVWVVCNPDKLRHWNRG